MHELLMNSKKAFQKHLKLETSLKNKVLMSFAEMISNNAEKLFLANELDLKEQEGKISKVLYQRLKFDQSKLDQVVCGIKDLIKLEDPCFKLLEKTKLDENLFLEKKSVPIGVIGVIFESRPDVIPQVLSLVLKSGNTAVLKGGREALHTNKAFMEIVEMLNQKYDCLSPYWAQLIESRREVKSMLDHSELLDLVIPRGSNEFVQYVMEHSKAPVLGHSDGICHLYVHHDADLNLALGVVIDSKTDYPSACNALETLLVHQSVALEFLPKLYHLSVEKGVQLRGCTGTRAVLSEINEAQEADWETEYGDLILSVRLVEDMEEAIQHIAQYGSGHTDGIISQSETSVNEFMRSVDSSSVFSNASTRFADGYRFGLGAELGISTAKTHARGPVGLEGLCIYKYMLKGSGQIAADYSGERANKKFLHQKVK